MKITNYKMLGISIVIGVISSGLWSFLSGTLAPIITASFIDVSNTFSDKIFLQISTHDLMTIHQSTHSLLSLILVFIIAITSTAIYFVTFYNKENFDKVKNRVYDLDLQKEKNSLEIKNKITLSSYADICNDIEKTDKIVKRSHLLSRIMLPSVLVILIVSSLYSTLTYKYVFESVMYFDYLLKVNASNLNDKTERDYQSRFTQIRKSKDYKNIIIELEKLALDNKLSFTPNQTVRTQEDLLKDHPQSKSIHVNNFRDEL